MRTYDFVQLEIPNRFLGKPVVSIRTQAVKLLKNFDHFKYSLRVNKKNILGDYSSFFKPSTWNYLQQLDWINLHRNDRKPIFSLGVGGGGGALSVSVWF